MPRGLAEKYGFRFDDNTEVVIMGISKIDDLPDDLKKIAVENSEQDNVK